MAGKSGFVDSKRMQEFLHIDMKKVDFPSAIFVLSGLSVMAIGFWTRTSLLISRESGRLLGTFVFLSGMFLFAWAGLCLQPAFFGNVQPVIDQVITNGPYSKVRHPLYLSMMILLIGINLMLRSIWGIICVFVLFLPVVTYRARLEEQALGKKFGIAWHKYFGRTSFLIPYLW